MDKIPTGVKNSIKGFVIQSIIMFSALYILAFIMVLYGVIAMKMTFAEAVETFGHIGFETVHLMIAMSIMLPGTVIIAAISYVRKKKQITADRNDTEK